jgi:diguanylate cyclase (GGDEF)-like protein
VTHPGERARRARRAFLAGAAVLAASPSDGARADAGLTDDERAWVAAHPVLLVAPEADYAPFTWVDDQGRHQGLSADLLALLEPLTGLEFRVAAAAPLAVNLERARRREVDLLTSLAANPEREAFLGFTSAYVAMPAVMIRRATDRRDDPVDALGAQTVAVGAGYGVENWLARTHPAVRRVPVADDATALRKVAFGETDLAVVDLASASHVIARDHLTGLRMAGETGFHYRLSLAWRKDWPMLGRVLEKGLAALDERQREALVGRWTGWALVPWWRRPETLAWTAGGAAAVGLVLAGLLSWNALLRRAVAQRTAALELEIAERTRLEARLRDQADHDELTELVNRAALLRDLPVMIGLARRQGWGIAVLFIDLDRFKAVNDTHGHAAGDALLSEVARRLRRAVRESDLVARLGGDEFVVVAQALQDPAADALRMARTVRHALCRPVRVPADDGAAVDLEVAASFGLAVLAPGAGAAANAPALLKDADAAMYRAKADGPSRIAVGRDGPVLGPDDAA